MGRGKRPFIRQRCPPLENLSCSFLLPPDDERMRRRGWVEREREKRGGGREEKRATESERPESRLGFLGVPNGKREGRC